MTGKQFYKCQVGRENGGCDFFLWAPESEGTAPNPYETPPASSWGSTAAASSTSGWGAAPSHSSDGGNNEDVKCNCGQPCKKYLFYLFSVPTHYLAKASFHIVAIGHIGLFLQRFLKKLSNVPHHHRIMFITRSVNLKQVYTPQNYYII